jgi:hypothetical protein
MLNSEKDFPYCIKIGFRAKKPGAAFTKCFENYSTILLRLFYNFSPRAFACFFTQNRSQMQQGKILPRWKRWQGRIVEVLLKDFVCA